MDYGFRNALESFGMAWELAKTAGLTSLASSWFGPDQACFCFNTSQWDKGVTRIFSCGSDPETLQMEATHYGLVGRVSKSDSGPGFYFEGYYKDGQPWVDPALLDAAINAKAAV